MNIPINEDDLAAELARELDNITAEISDDDMLSLVNRIADAKTEIARCEKIITEANKKRMEAMSALAGHKARLAALASEA